MSNKTAPTHDNADLGLAAAWANDVLTVQGKNLSADVTVKIGGSAEAHLRVSSAELGELTVPEGVSPGIVEIAFFFNQTYVTSLPLIVYGGAAAATVPVVLPPLASICNDVQIRDVKGEIKTGLRDCGSAALKDCTADGETNCRATAAAPAALASAFTAADIKSGKTIAGVLGTLASAASVPVCATDGATGCVTSTALCLCSGSRLR